MDRRLTISVNSAELAELELHVSRMWPQLVRSTHQALEAARDVKLAHSGNARWPLYLSASEDLAKVRDRLRRTMRPEAFRQIELRILSGAPEQITDHGLVYLPGRYVVPGGRFNEMYGWDSYFIARGLICEGRTGLAQSIADLQIYQVKHYGTVLNCNRTYCLTRSHPPFLGRLVLAVFRATGDIEWLRAALPYVERYHAYWSSLPQFLPGLELSRYHALGEGAAPEVVHGELDATGRNHYDRLRDWFRAQGDEAPGTRIHYDRATDSLTTDAYKDDRSIRESGFDLTCRFGHCGMGTRDFAPVCLNSLLWRMEKDIARIRHIVSATPQSIQHWEELAANRAKRMHHYFWDPGDGMFLDWQLSTAQRRFYPFATTFWPLWTGWASQEQAQRIAENLERFETPHGLLASTTRSGCQWDAPFTWAPLVLMAAEGLADYGFAAAAARVAGNFLTTISADFKRTGNLFEKYDATTGSSDLGDGIIYGYCTNEPGFGWTNAVASILLKCASRRCQH